ncbi:MAG: hypothetical protein ACI4IS_00240 [Acutalibacteraceae bacterium]
MTPQEVRDNFVQSLAENAYLNMCTTQEMYIVISALEKQIPKKPLDICTPVVTWGLCPTCKGELNKLGRTPNRVFIQQSFCQDCGQALDWSDEE